MFEWYIVEERQREREREAAVDRLLHEVALGYRRRPRLRSRAMIWLGSRLLESGRRLQARDTGRLIWN